MSKNFRENRSIKIMTLWSFPRCFFFQSRYHCKKKKCVHRLSDVSSLLPVTIFKIPFLLDKKHLSMNHHPSSNWRKKKGPTTTITLCNITHCLKENSHPIDSIRKDVYICVCWAVFFFVILNFCHFSPTVLVH